MKDLEERRAMQAALSIEEDALLQDIVDDGELFGRL